MPEDVAAATGGPAFRGRRGQKGLGGPVRLLWPMLRLHRGALAGAGVALVVASSMTLAIGWGLKTIVDKGFADASGGFLNRALLELLAVIVVMAVASYARYFLVNMVAEKVVADLRLRLYRHLLSLDLPFFDQNKTGDQVSRINADTTVLQLVLTSNLPAACRHGLMLAGGIIMLCVVSPAMTAHLLVAVPLVVGPMMYMARRVRRKSRETQGRVGDIGAYAHETLSGIDTIQSFGYEGEAARRFGLLATDIYKTAVKYVHARAFMTAFAIAMVFGAIGVILWSGGHKVLAGEISAGQLSAFIFYAATVAGAVMSLGEAMGDFSRAAGAADRILQLLHAAPQVENPSSAIKLPENLAGYITFENVSFSYPTRPGIHALDDVSFTVTAGEVVALVGPSGSGKTTIFQLLQRFYDPQQGAITIDGLDLCDVDLHGLRDSLAVVSQHPAIFSMSVAENIRLARPGASDADVAYAAEMAQAHEFIAALPQGYETVVGERGSRLSGGQRQRIAIARAILKGAKILLLDEATSALDSSSEHAVQKALRQLMQGRTTLVIAHRLSTVRDADRILVVDGGRIVAEGTHNQLYGRDQLYTHLAGLQDLQAAG
jgi:ATP-binding cassette subfamily B protein